MYGLGIRPNLSVFKTGFISFRKMVIYGLINAGLILTTVQENLKNKANLDREL